MMGMEWYLNVSERPFYGGTYYLSKWRHGGSFEDFHLTLVLCGVNRPWWLAGWSRMISYSPSGANKIGRKKNRLHWTWQQFVACFHCCRAKHHTTSFLFHLTLKELCGNGLFMNEELIENWACAVTMPTMNTGPASPVISLGCGWLWLWWRSSITPRDNDCMRTAKSGPCDRFLFAVALDVKMALRGVVGVCCQAFTGTSAAVGLLNAWQVNNIIANGAGRIFLHLKQKRVFVHVVLHGADSCLTLESFNSERWWFNCKKASW